MAALAEAGIETFFPTLTVETRWSDRSKFVTKPIFPGYIFLQVHPGRLDVVRRTAGIVQVLGYTAVDAAVVSDLEIASLRLAVESRKPLAECPYVAGQKVCVTTGPMAGAVGVVTRSKGATRIVIAVELLRRAVSVEIDAADVSTVPA